MERANDWKWDDKNHEWICPVCLIKLPKDADLPNFCPNCGTYNQRARRTEQASRVVLTEGDEIVQCKYCDNRYENLDGTMECMFHECLDVNPDDYCAWGKPGSGVKERKRTKEEEEEYQKWLDSIPSVMASSTTVLTGDTLEQLKNLGLLL